MNSTPQSLLLRLRQPDDAAWGQFVDLYTPLLFHWATRSGLQQQDALELVQEMFLTLVQALPSFEYDRHGSFRAWLYTMLRRKWVDLRRKQTRLPGNDAGLSAAQAPDELVEIHEREYRAFLIRRGLELVEQELGATTIAAFRATALDERPTSEVACELGISENAVYQARRRVLRKLKEQLAGLWD
jgi:RNA polymerase sigma-70 factor (ECF subfamily)